MSPPDLTAEWAAFERALMAYRELNGRIARDNVAGYSTPPETLLRRQDLYRDAIRAEDALKAKLRDRIAHRKAQP